MVERKVQGRVVRKVEGIVERRVNGVFKVGLKVGLWGGLN
jgi:hypothetical protein